jgi:hypothetical protein
MREGLGCRFRWFLATFSSIWFKIFHSSTHSTCSCSIQMLFLKHVDVQLAIRWQPQPVNPSHTELKSKSYSWKCLSMKFRCVSDFSSKLTERLRNENCLATRAIRTLAQCSPLSFPEIVIMRRMSTSNHLCKQLTQSVFQTCLRMEDVSGSCEERVIAHMHM